MTPSAQCQSTADEREGRARQTATAARPERRRKTAALAGALWVTLAPAAGGCYRHTWRPAADPLASVVVGGGTPLRVTTRVLATGVAHRYVLASARVERDSVVGLASEEYQQRGAGQWSVVPRDGPARRVAVAAPDVVEVVRREREFSPQRTVTLVVVVLALVAAAAYGALAAAMSQPGY
jgi:hypothetical protein